MNREVLDIMAIEVRSKEVRAYLERNRPDRPLAILNRYPVGCCKAASLLLLQWLHEQEGLRGAFGVANGERPDPEFPGESKTHFWLEVGAVIVDITADQFEDCYRPIHVSADRAWHDTFSGWSRYPQTTLIPLIGPHLQEYEVMKSVLQSSQAPSTSSLRCAEQ